MSIGTIIQNLRTQDNRITADPIFIVEEQVRIYGVDQNYHTCTPIYHDIYDCESSYDSREEAIAAIRDECDREIDDDELNERIEEVFYATSWQFVTACLTEVGCQAYIDSNGHNHKGELRIYAAGSFRNREWQELRAFLMALPSLDELIEASHLAYTMALRIQTERKESTDEEQAVTDLVIRMNHIVQKLHEVKEAQG